MSSRPAALRTFAFDITFCTSSLLMGTLSNALPIAGSHSWMSVIFDSRTESIKSSLKIGFVLSLNKFSYSVFQRCSTFLTTVTVWPFLTTSHGILLFRPLLTLSFPIYFLTFHVFPPLWSHKSASSCCFAIWNLRLYFRLIPSNFLLSSQNFFF